ncbi:class E sortase [Nocardioides sp. LHG3406-4]|uniref:class E sortase n=1 Tax=Nocardioides sp. LHG3406-4 TaxID=2804575 RepID=UPI003CE6AA3E
MSAEPAPTRRRRGRILTIVGLLMVLAGLVMLGWVGWQMYGTNWVSARKHTELVEKVEKSWHQGKDTVEASDGTVQAVVRIPRFGDDYAVPLLEGVADDALAAGFGHFESSAAPGAKGNYALAAHRVTHGEPLRRMPELVPGDEIVVETREWTYTYVLDTGGDDLIVPFTQTWVVDPLPTNPDPDGPQPEQKPGQRLITLTTCSEIFHTDNRMIAFGHLLTKEPRTT